MSKSVSSSGDGLLSLDWSQRVEKEVTKINQEDKIKVQKQISAAWKSNAATIKKNRPPEKKVSFSYIEGMNAYICSGSFGRNPSYRSERFRG